MSTYKASKNLGLETFFINISNNIWSLEFEDGKKVKVKDTIARAAVLKHAGMRRPAEKLAFQKKIEKSYRDLLNALKGR